LARDFGCRTHSEEKNSALNRRFIHTDFKFNYVSMHFYIVFHISNCFVTLQPEEEEKPGGNEVDAEKDDDDDDDEDYAVHEEL
jgi:hypothetical protein